MKITYLTILLITFSFQATLAQSWITDFEKAKTIASETNHNIVLVFQGSDWCGPCIKLDKEIWSTSEFQELSKDHFVMLKADFPKRKNNKLTSALQEHNNQLAAQYNSNGYFPFVVVLNPKGKVLGNLGYEKSSPKLYYQKLKALEQ